MEDSGEGMVFSFRIGITVMGLDPATEDPVLMGDAHNEGRTVVVATHDSAIASKADINLEMKDGKLSDG